MGGGFIASRKLPREGHGERPRWSMRRPAGPSPTIQDRRLDCARIIASHDDHDEFVSERVTAFEQANDNRDGNDDEVGWRAFNVTGLEKQSYT